MMVYTESRGCVPLRIQVKYQHICTRLGKRRREIHNTRGLADATLLVYDSDDSRVLREGELTGL